MVNDQRHLRVCTFRGLQNLPIFVARRQGLFAAHHLDVEINYTAGSLPQLAGLAGGEYHLVQTAPDNVVNVDTHPAAFGLDPHQAPRVVMICGGSTGPLSLYAHSTITEFAGLRGAALGVDNPTSGFALVLRDMLARNGLQLSRDYTLAGAGGTSARLDALTSDAVPATILYAPFDVLAAAAGFRLLATSTDYYVAYASLATAGLQSWLEAHADVVVRYIAAIRQALRWIYEPVHMLEVQDILSQEPAFELTPVLAKQACTAFVDPVSGFGVDAMLSQAGLQQVIDLRAAYSSARSYGVPEDYLDMRWYQQASALLKG